MIPRPTLIASGCAVAVIAGLFGLWQFEKGQASKAREQARLEQGKALAYQHIAELGQTVTLINETRDRNIAQAREAANAATEEVRNAPDLDSALDAYGAGIDRVRLKGHAPATDTGTDGGGPDASQ